MYARYMRSLIAGTASGLFVLILVWIAQYLLIRTSSTALARGEGVFCVGMDIYAAFLVLLIAIFALAGIASVRGNKLVLSLPEASKAGAVAGATTCVISAAALLVPWLARQLLGRTDVLPGGFELIAYLVFGAGTVFTIYLIAGTIMATLGSIVYYRYREKRIR